MSPRIRRPRIRGAVACSAALAAVLAASPLAARLTSRRDPTPSLENAVHAHAPARTTALARARQARAEAARAIARHGIRQADASTWAQTGRWSAPSPMMVSGINAVVLPTGRVLLFGNVPSSSGTNQADAWTWNPGDGSWRHVLPPVDPDTGRPANVWCAGHAFLPDGRLVVAGGNRRYPVDDQDPALGNGWEGLDHVYTFDPFTERWTAQPRMAHGRWYPTLATLTDGRVVIFGGLDEHGHEDVNTDVEVFTPSAARDGVGTIQVKPTAARWSQLYPHMVRMPDNRIVVAGPDKWDTAVLNTSTWRWTDYPDIPRTRLWGAAVVEPYDAAAGPRALTLVGGYDTVAATGAEPDVYRLDLANPGAGFAPQAPLGTGRAHANAVFLADGTLMAVGGGVGNGPSQGLSSGPVLTAELRAEDGSWTTIPGQAVRRTYHSTAALLPDGRVVSTGDDLDGTIRPMEIYSPAYLFAGTRPVIDAAPSAVAYGSRFTVRTARARSVRRVLLIAPASVTHANDMGQRVVRLEFAASSDGVLTVTAPPGAGPVPGGYHMLVIVDDQGVPSVARWVLVGTRGDPDPPADPTPPAGPPATTPTPPARPPDPSPTPPAPSPPSPAPAPPATAAPAPAPVAVTRVAAAPSPLTSAALRRGRRGRYAVTTRAATAGVVSVRIDTPRVHRVACRSTLRHAGRATCRVPAVLRPGDRVTVTLRTRRGEWARVLSPRA